MSFTYLRALPTPEEIENNSIRFQQNLLPSKPIVITRSKILSAEKMTDFC